MQSLSRSTFGAIASGMLGQISLIGSGILVARALGAEDRGYLALLLLFPLCISTLVGAGMPLAVTYFLAGQQRCARSVGRLLLRVVPAQGLFIVAVHALVLLAYLDGKPHDVSLAAWLSLPVGPLTLTQEYGSALLQGQRRFSVLNAVRVLLPVSYVATVLMLVLAGRGTLPLLVLAWAFALAVAAVAALSIVAKALSSSTDTASGGPTFRELAGFGISGFLGGASPIETFRLDQLVAGLFLSPAALGVYVVGRAFANIPVFIATSTITIAYPSVARAGPGREGMRLVWRFFLGVVTCNVLVVAVLSLLIPWVLPRVFGEEFRESIALSQVLLVSTALYGGYRLLGEGMRGLGRPHISSFAELSMWPWLLVGLPLLAMHWGTIGLATSAVLGYAIALTVTLMLIRRSGISQAFELQSPHE